MLRPMLATSSNELEKRSVIHISYFGASPLEDSNEDIDTEDELNDDYKDYHESRPDVSKKVWPAVSLLVIVAL